MIPRSGACAQEISMSWRLQGAYQHWSFSCHRRNPIQLARQDHSISAREKGPTPQQKPPQAGVAIEPHAFTVAVQVSVAVGAVRGPDLVGALGQDHLAMKV